MNYYDWHKKAVETVRWRIWQIYDNVGPVKLLVIPSALKFVAREAMSSCDIPYFTLDGYVLSPEEEERKARELEIPENIYLHTDIFGVYGPKYLYLFSTPPKV